MHGLFFYIGLGLGLAIAAGVRPFLPGLLAGALGRGDALGVHFAHGGYSFLQSAGWLAALAAALVVAYALQARVGVERMDQGLLGAALAAISVGVAALLFAGTLADHGDSAWPGLVGGAGCGLVAQVALRPLLARTRARLPDRVSREILTLYADGAALVLAAIAALLHPLGYVALAALAWLLAGAQRRAGEKYAGLRILRE